MLSLMHPSLEHTPATLNEKMRPGLVLSLILAAVLPSLPMFADPVSGSNSDLLVPFSDIVEVRIGAHRSVVAKCIGEPSDKFSSDVWVYWKHRDPRRAANDPYQTLIIVFTGECVTHMRFTDTKATRVALAEFRHGQAIAQQALTHVTPPVGEKKGRSVGHLK